jgi:hypothetical protein
LGKGLNYNGLHQKLLSQKNKGILREENIVICTDLVRHSHVETFDFRRIKDLPSDRNITGDAKFGE